MKKIGCTATIFFPTQEGPTASVTGDVHEEQIVMEAIENGYTKFEVQSAKYTFMAR